MKSEQERESYHDELFENNITLNGPYVNHLTDPHLDLKVYFRG
jgi:hypothetical protein